MRGYLHYVGDQRIMTSEKVLSMEGLASPAWMTQLLFPVSSFSHLVAKNKGRWWKSPVHHQMDGICFQLTEVVLPRTLRGLLCWQMQNQNGENYLMSFLNALFRTDDQKTDQVNTEISQYGIYFSFCIRLWTANWNQKQAQLHQQFSKDRQPQSFGPRVPESEIWNVVYVGWESRITWINSARKANSLVDIQ